jgi:glycosyltransferase involved in cell wall biosynthesis
MKIVHVLPALPKGGAERVGVDLANAAIANGHQVGIVLAYPVDPALLQNSLDPRIEVRFIRRRRSRFGVYGSLVRWVATNRRWIMGQDVIHCHLTFGSIFGSLVYSLRANDRPAVVETYHAVGMAIPVWRDKFAKTLMRQRDAVALIADDPFWSRYRQRHPRRNVRLIPNGVGASAVPSCAAVAAYRRSIGVSDGIRLAGSVGRLLRERRPHALLDAFAKAVAAGGIPDDVDLLLGGEGPEKFALADRARALGLAGRVYLPGLVRNPAEAFACLELYLTVNVGPATGVAALEAAMSGLPVIAYQMLEGYETGGDDWIWSSRNTKALADRLGALMRDSDERRSLAVRQQAYARKNHSLATMAQAYDELYQSALAPHRESD